MLHTCIRKLLTLFITSLSVITFAATDEYLYIMNGSAETLSKLNLSTNTVTTNFITTGQVPNEIIYYRNNIFLVNSGTDDIRILNPTADNTYSDIITLATGSNPYDLAVVGHNKIYVTNNIAGTVSVINTETNTVLKNIEVGKSPQGVLFFGTELNGNYAYVANTGLVGWGTYEPGTVSVINTITDSVEYTIDVPLNPQDFAVDPMGRIHVLCTGDYATVFASVVVIDPMQNPPAVIDTISIGGSPGDIVITKEGKGYCVAWGDGTNGFLYEYDAITGTVMHSASDPILVGPNVSRLYYDADKDVLWIPTMKVWAGDGSIQKFDVSADSIVWVSDIVGNGTQDLVRTDSVLDSDPWGDEIVFFNEGTNWNKLGQNFFPENVLGKPGQSFCPQSDDPLFNPEEFLSLGDGGEIVIKFTNNRIINNAGVDFTIFGNASYSHTDSSIETRTGIVSVSQDGTTWYDFDYNAASLTGFCGLTPTADWTSPLNPYISGGDSFDLSDVGLSWASFVKIKDCGQITQDDGTFALDAVVAVNSEAFTGVRDNSTTVPEQLTLNQNYPNPFNSETIISYKVPSDTYVRLTVFNSLGQHVKTLIENNVSTGYHSVKWNATDITGKLISSGIYFYRLETNNRVITKKMILMF